MVRTRRGGGEAPEAVGEARRLAAQLKEALLEPPEEEEPAELEASSSAEEEHEEEEEEQQQEEALDVPGGPAGAAAGGESLAATCCVCWEEAATHLFVPCGHQCVCMHCGERVMEASEPLRCCVVCRASVSMVIKLFAG